MKLPGKLRVCKSVWDLGRGLMFRKNPLHFIYWFQLNWQARHRITMWFVFCPIDIVILDAKRKIVELKEGLQPWSHYRPQHSYQEFVELPSGSCKRFSLQVGQTLALDEEAGTVTLR